MSTHQKNGGKPLATTLSSDSHSRQVTTTASTRRIQYRFNAAPLDTSPSAPGAKAGDRIVTDSASNLKALPYAVVSAKDKNRVLSPRLKDTSYSTLGSPFNTPEIIVPEDVESVEIFLGNDAYASRRLHPLFRVTPNPQGLTVVNIHELPQARLDRLQADSVSGNAYPKTAQGQAARTAGGTYIGYLTGDTWKTFSYEFSLADVTRLCGSSSLRREFKADKGRSRVTPPSPTAAPAEAPTTTDPRPLARIVIDNTRVAKRTPIGLPSNSPGNRAPPRATTPTLAVIRNGNFESLSIADWRSILAPIYEGTIEELSGTTHAEFAGYIDLPVVNIRLRYQAGAFANAVGAGRTVQPADVLKRTNPVTYKGLIEAAWKSGVDELVLSSTWRPMLGSKLHRMGVAVDVIFVDDYDDRTDGGKEIDKFKVHISSGEAPSRLYSTFSAIALGDNANLGGFKADPWNRKPKDNLHKNHLHVSAVDPDAK